MFPTRTSDAEQRRERWIPHEAVFSEGTGNRAIAASAAAPRQKGTPDPWARVWAALGQEDAADIWALPVPNASGQQLGLQRSEHPPVEAETRIDPLVAARLHNIHHSLIHRLPDEILLSILVYLTSDIVSYHILWRVSRVFRRIMASPECLGRIWPGCPYHIDLCPWRTKFPSEASYLPPACHHKAEIRDLVRKDLLCRACSAAALAAPPVRGRLCAFDACCGEDRMHCAGCGVDHPSSAFSPRQIRRPWAARTCVGREGHVRLCEHVTIQWADVEAALVECRSAGRGDMAYLERFGTECLHPSHNLRCSALMSPPTPPRAAFRWYSRTGPVSLDIKWVPHTQGAATLRRDQRRIPAEEMRSALRAHRRNAAGFIAPAPNSGPGVLPEMRCFDPNSGCKCLDYGTVAGADDGPRTSPAQPFPCLRLPRRNTPQRIYQQDATGHSAHDDRLPSAQTDVQACRRCWGGAGRGLRVSYSRAIPLGRVPAHGPIVPTHEWLHALDVESYTGLEMGDGTRRVCRDASCANYHRLPVTYHDAVVSWPCDRSCVSSGAMGSEPRVAVPSHTHLSGLNVCQLS